MDIVGDCEGRRGDWVGMAEEDGAREGRKGDREGGEVGPEVEGERVGGKLEGHADVDGT